MKGHPIPWSAAELAWVEANATRPRAEAHAEFQRRFGRPDVTVTAFAALCKRKGWLTGRTGRFPPGHTTHNKGRKGYCPRGSEKGWFRKGETQGRAAKIAQPIGAERITKDGYLQRKVNNDRPFQRRWAMVHLLNWEAANGPLPNGHALKCLDGDRHNTAADNWIAVPRALLPRLAGAPRSGAVAFDSAPPELKPAILATAKLEHAAREARRKARNATSPEEARA